MNPQHTNAHHHRDDANHDNNASAHDDQRLPHPDDLTPAADDANAVLRAMNAVLLGQERLHQLVLVGILARGHILLEGMPGLGKTALIQSLGKLLALDFKRVQFTPDLMPSDILGCPILQQHNDGSRRMEFQQGPVFTNVLLADEINRASPKTQSALLEAMQERRATIMGESRNLPFPFFVLASQNPIELEGTYPLPEAQLDRFMFKLDVSMPDTDVLERIILTRRRGETPDIKPVIPPGGLTTLFDAVDSIVAPRPVARFIAKLVSATHPHDPDAPDHVQRFVAHGASPRAAIAIAEAARAQALLARRPTIGFDDVRNVAPWVLNHRIILNHEARFERINVQHLVEQLLRSLDASRAGAPRNIELLAGDTQ